MKKVRYFLNCAAKRAARQPRQCPSCGCSQTALVQTKYWVTELRKCAECRLLFRHPRDSSVEQFRFYQEEYGQGFTTDCPPEPELRRLLATQFQGHEKDYRRYLDVIQALGIVPGAKLIDYGCSWGYGSWQLQQAGYQVQGFEISAPRARYGRELLGTSIVETVEGLAGGIDVFFSAHVMEHVPSIGDAVALARKLVKPGGWFIAFTPNGTESFRLHQPENFRMLWGQVHPNLLSDDFWRRMFNERPLLVTSSPYEADRIRNWTRQGYAAFNLSGDELLAAVRLD